MLEIGPTILAAFVLGRDAGLKQWDNARSPARSRAASRCSSTTSPPASSVAPWPSSACYIIGPITFWITQGLGWLVERPRQRGLLPAGVDRRRARQGAVPEQRDQPRRLHPARCRAGGGGRQVDLLHDRVEPRPRPRHPDRDAAVRTARDPSDGSGRDGRPLPRRHPRDLLPVRADEADPASSRPSSVARPACCGRRSSASAWSARPRPAASSPGRWSSPPDNIVAEPDRHRARGGRHVRRRRAPARLRPQGVREWTPRLDLEAAKEKSRREQGAPARTAPLERSLDHAAPPTQGEQTWQPSTDPASRS